MLGVDRELILDDYELTNVTRSEEAHRRTATRTRSGRYRRRACAALPVGATRRDGPHLRGSTTTRWRTGFLLASGVTAETLDTLRAELLTDDAA